MKELSNILVMSISKKIPLLKAVQHALFRIDQTSLVYGGDIDSTCIGRYFVDEFWKMPNLSTLSTQELINYCISHSIGSIIPTRDGELIYFARHRQELSVHGIHVMVPSLKSVQLSLDKYLFASTLSQLNYPVIPTFEDSSDIESNNIVVKERFGAGSQNLGLMLTKDEAQSFAEQLHSPIYQPYIEGEEYSIDLYINRKGKAKGCIVRKRDLVVNGESQITTISRNLNLEEMCSTLAEDLGLYGHVMFQVIIDRDGYYHIVECNCRFGGASTLSLAAGLDSFYWFLLESAGEDLDNIPFNRLEKELKLIRYPEDLIL